MMMYTYSIYFVFNFYAICILILSVNFFHLVYNDAFTQLLVYILNIKIILFSLGLQL